FVLGAVPVYNNQWNVGNVPVQRAVRSWYDNLLSGQRKRAEAASLWDMPLEEFTRFVREDLIPNVERNANFFGYNNRSAQLDILTGFSQARSPDETNVWAAVDLAGVVPIAGATRLARAGMQLPATLLNVGGRRQWGNLMAKAATE